MRCVEIFEEDDNSTIVVLEHKGECFYGESMVAPEDKEYFSKLFGGRLAEARATREAVKYELAEARKELHTLDNLLKACSLTKKFDSTSPSAKVLYRQYNVKKKQVAALKDRSATMKKIINDMIDQRDKYIKKMEDKKRTKADKE